MHKLEMEKMRRSEAAAAAKIQASPAKRNPFASPSKAPKDDKGGSPTLTRLLGGGGGGEGGKKKLFCDGDSKTSGDENGVPKKTTSPASKPQMQIKLSTPTAKSLKPVVLRDFFGRIIKSPTNAEEEESGAKMGKPEKEKKKTDPNSDSIWFCFKEGYSNAVRKPIKIRELL